MKFHELQNKINVQTKVMISQLDRFFLLVIQKWGKYYPDENNLLFVSAPECQDTVPKCSFFILCVCFFCFFLDEVKRLCQKEFTNIFFFD